MIEYVSVSFAQGGSSESDSRCGAPQKIHEFKGYAQRAPEADEADMNWTNGAGNRQRPETLMCENAN